MKRKLKMSALPLLLIPVAAHSFAGNMIVENDTVNTIFTSQLLQNAYETAKPYSNFFYPGTVNGAVHVGSYNLTPLWGGLWGSVQESFMVCPPGPMNATTCHNLNNNKYLFNVYDQTVEEPTGDSILFHSCIGASYLTETPGNWAYCNQDTLSAGGTANGQYHIYAGQKGTSKQVGSRIYGDYKVTVTTECNFTQGGNTCPGNIFKLKIEDLPYSITQLARLNNSVPQNGIAVDYRGNIFVANANYTRIREIPANNNPPYGSGDVIPIATNYTFGALAGIATDSKGDLFVISDASPYLGVTEVLYDDGKYDKINVLSSDPAIAVTVDNDDNVFVVSISTSTNVGVISEFLNNNGSYGSPITVVNNTGDGGPSGIAVDYNDNLFISDVNNSSITYFPYLGKNTYGTPQSKGSGLNGPMGIAIDLEGNIFIANNGDNTIREIPQYSNTSKILASGLSEPWSIAVSKHFGLDHSVVFSDSGSGSIKKIINYRFKPNP